jgi:hypothetical protein
MWLWISFAVAVAAILAVPVVLDRRWRRRGTAPGDEMLSTIERMGPAVDELVKAEATKLGSRIGSRS